jgi:pimeloyl-ACP methyl ester carboxylesterase
VAHDPGARGATAAINGVDLYYEAAGDGFPLVLVHGGGVDARMWDDQVGPFAERYRVVRYDLRGAGRSGWVDAPYSHRDDLAGLLDHLGAERAVVVGLSLGGAVALDFALAYPERAATLVLAASGLGGYAYPDEVSQPFVPLFDALRAGDLAHARELCLAHPLYRETVRHPTAGPRLREMTAGYAFADRSRARAVFDRPLEPPAAARLGELRCPTLEVEGDREYPPVLAVADALAGGIAGAERVTLQGPSHMPNMEAPEEFNRAVLDFLGRNKDATGAYGGWPERPSASRSWCQ